MMQILPSRKKNKSKEGDSLVIANTSTTTTSITSITSITRKDWRETIDRSRALKRKNYSISTTFDGKNGNFGAMFDVQASNTTTVRIQSIDFLVNDLQHSNCNLLVYLRPGTHVGHTTSPKGWTLLLNSSRIKCHKRTRLPFHYFNKPLRIQPHQRCAFYILLDVPHLRYVNGTKLNRIYAQDQYLTIFEGSGVSGYFGTSVQPRVWSGAIYYTLPDLRNNTTNSSTQHNSPHTKRDANTIQTTRFVRDISSPSNVVVQDAQDSKNISEKQSDDQTCRQTLTTTFRENLGSYGNMFDIRTFQDIFLYQFDFHTDLTHDVYFELYTKLNGFRDDNAKGDLTIWTLLQKGVTTGLGLHRGTPIVGFENLVIPANTTRSFYITLNTTNMRYFSIAQEMPDATVGTPFINSTDLEIQVGVSVGDYPMRNAFFGKRVWSGALHYGVYKPCQSTMPSVTPTNLPSSLPTQYPSPIPSRTPSEKPTSQPSGNPSSLPSQTHSDLPTWVPSDVPSVTESMTPSLEPTVVRSDFPTNFPSTEPSAKESVSPSLAESEVPSSVDASEIPSIVPTSLPSANATSLLTIEVPETDSIEPSMFPSIINSTHPTLVPSMSEMPTCIDHREVQTPLTGETGAYGNMFTVTSKQKPLSISTVSFFSDFAGELVAEVYTRPGTYVGFENNTSAWTMVSQATVYGSRMRGTQIPKDRFSPIHLGPNETVALYVTLTTPDIRYSKGNESIIASSELLDIHAGAGLADYPFSSEYFLYQPRSFNGAIHFDVQSECLPTVDVVFSFEVQAPLKFERESVLRTISNSVEETLNKLFSTEPLLIDHSNNQRVRVDTVRTEERSEDSCDILTPLFRCLPINVVVAVKYGEGLKPGELKFDLLSFQKDVTLGVDLSFHVAYVGNVSTSTMLKVTMTSKGEETHEMGLSQELAYEESTKQFFQDSLGDKGLTILDIKIKGQSVQNNEERGRSLWERLLQTPTSSASVIEIQSEVMAEYMPPPVVSLEHAVEEVVAEKGGELTKKVKSADPYFEQFDEAKFETVPEVTVSPSATTVPTDRGFDTTLEIRWIWFGAAIGGLFLVVIGFTTWWKVYQQKRTARKYKSMVTNEANYWSNQSRRGRANFWIPQTGERRHNSLVFEEIDSPQSGYVDQKLPLSSRGRNRSIPNEETTSRRRSPDRVRDTRSKGAKSQSTTQDFDLLGLGDM